jgi:hypothetical protein
MRTRVLLFLLLFPALLMSTVGCGDDASKQPKLAKPSNIDPEKNTTKDVPKGKAD